MTLLVLWGKWKKSLFLPHPSLSVFSVSLVNMCLFQWSELEVIGDFMWSNKHLVDM